MTTERDKLERRAFLWLLALVSLLFLYLMKPFFGVIFWACVIAVLAYPLHARCLRRCGDRPNIAALITLLVCLLVGILPALFIGGAFFQEGAALYQRLQSGELDPARYLEQIREGFPAVQQLLARFDVGLDDVKVLLSDVAVAVSRFIAQNAVSIGQGTVQWFISLGLMLYVLFFLLRDGPRLVNLVERALPLGDERERLLFAKFGEVTRATVKGSLVVAAVQGALGGLIFWFLGIQGALVWGVVMALVSLLPVVGAALIWGPVAIYLFAVGDWVQGAVLVVFGVGVIGLVDNVLRPILVGRDTKLPDYIVLLSTLGGFSLFGLNGFVIGPLLAALFVAAWQIFMREFNVGEEDQVAPPVPPRDAQAPGMQQGPSDTSDR